MLLTGWLEIEYRWDQFERSLRTNYGRKFTRSALRSTANRTASDATTHSGAATAADGGGACCAADELRDTSHSQEACSNADRTISADAQLSMDGEKDWGKHAICAIVACKLTFTPWLFFRAALMRRWPTLKNNVEETWHSGRIGWTCDDFGGVECSSVDKL